MLILNESLKAFIHLILEKYCIITLTIDMNNTSFITYDVVYTNGKKLSVIIELP